jgi:hypothetical protein
MNFAPFTYFNKTAPIISYIGSTFSLSSASSYTFTNLNLGGGNGLYVLSVQAEAGAANRVVSSVVIAGVTSSLAYQLTTPNNTTSTSSSLFYLRQSATASTVVVNFSGGVVSRCFVAVYRITNNRSDIPYQGRTASATSGTGLSISFTSLNDNSIIISSQTNGLDTAGPITWTNATSVYDLSLGTGTTRIAGATSSVAAGGNLTISTSHTNSTQPIVLVSGAWN